MSAWTGFGGAAALAQELHSGQVDKAGHPYFEHLASVVMIFVRNWPDAPEYAKDAAWLHDALEDTSATPESLLAAGVPAKAIAIIKQVSRPENSVYLDWIKDLATNGDLWAVRVKLADNEHNSHPERHLPGSDLVEKRYTPARKILLSNLISRELASLRPTETPS